MAMRRIEDLLRWTFVLEMPKARRDGLPGSAVAASSWGLIERVGTLGTTIDGGRGGGALPDDDTPHPDAVIVAEAVAALDDAVVTEGDEHDLLAGWPDFGAAGEAAVARAWDLATAVVGGRRVLRSSLSALVRNLAVLGEWPDWRCERPALVEECGANGTPRWSIRSRIAVRWTPAGEPIAWVDAEIDGYDRRRQRPKPGAYRRQTLVPDPAGALERRIRYGLVHGALRHLAGRLDGLGGQTLVGPFASPTPWADEVVHTIESETAENLTCGVSRV